MRLSKKDLLVVLVLTLIFIFYSFRDIFLVFIIGGTVGIVARKISGVYENVTGLSKKTSSIVCLFFFYVVTVIFVLILGKKIICEIGDFICYIPSFYTHKVIPALKKLESTLLYFNNIAGIEGSIMTIFSEYQVRLGEVIGNLSVNIAGKIAKVAVSLPSVLFKVVIGVITSFFVCADYDVICGFLLDILPAGLMQRCDRLKRVCSKTVFNMIKSYLIIFLLTLFQLSIGLFFLKVKHFFAVSFIVATLDILPLIGTGLVLVPWAVVEFINNNVPLSIGILALFFIITAVRNIAEPKILGKNMGVHPLVSLIVLCVGLEIGGVVFSVALLLAVSVIKQYFRSEKFITKKRSCSYNVIEGKYFSE